MSIGVEWLGRDHPAVRCLRYGVAVHHGKLPSPFLREVERLLASGTIKITVASPTLAQGLNLNAAVLLIPNIVRQQERISGEELANVAGRAGRAFVDTEGLVLHVIYDRHNWRRNEWRELVNEGHARSIMSGLIKVIDEVIQRLAENGIEGAEGYEYLANAREAWMEDADEPDGEALEDLVAKADSIVLGLVEALDSDAADLPELLEEALSGSLWERQLERERALRENTTDACSNSPRPADLERNDGCGATWAFRNGRWLGDGPSSRRDGGRACERAGSGRLGGFAGGQGRVA